MRDDRQHEYRAWSDHHLRDEALRHQGMVEQCATCSIAEAVESSDEVHEHARKERLIGALLPSSTTST
ncbi:hypothetical protein JRI60_13855 [Archangium violaceum]|uniref:hypothetical protein n=1 Tax=Archangium violaceum TaxID=83451 RepID=UPI001950E508|nr:hypothetical protein [Archangium violaceum]QRO00030.1 hypothetical protein JRI60_13855 [Archangium violaceum]